MSLKHEDNGDYSEKHATGAPAYEPDGSSDPEVQAVAAGNLLHQDLKGRHMQMIAMQVQRPETTSVYSTNICVQWRSNWCWSVC
jgi:amino acid transporter